ncbi:MAG TPA: DUF4010 domain-containing protein [Phenylobacterium sp.]|nr:DUF4010 domain-containing protein [Phenylobacterium sp.]
MDLAVALGVGLLVGGERERRKREKGSPASAGIRTFAVASLAGAVGFMLGGVSMLAVVTVAVTAFAALATWRISDRDPGITTEIALVLTVLVGGLAMLQPGVAAAVGVAAAILLAARTPLHHFVGSVLTEGEVRDALIFAGATLVVLPLLPDQAMGPFGALNPRAIWIVVVLILAISAAGHVAVRMLGARFGLPIAGLASGFVSSVATIAAMGARVAKTPAVMSSAVAGAVLSTVATVIQMTLLVGATSLPTLRALGGPLIWAGLAAVAYGAAFTIKAIRHTGEEDPAPGQAFNLTAALAFAATLAVVLVASAALRDQFGAAGSIVAAAVAGLVDTHAAAISIAALVASGRMTPEEAVIPILAAFSSNTVTKIVFAWTSGGPGFAARVVPGLLLVVIFAWIGATMMQVLR